MPPESGSFLFPRLFLIRRRSTHYAGLWNVPRSDPPADGEKDRLMDRKPEETESYDGIRWCD